MKPAIIAAIGLAAAAPAGADRPAGTGAKPMTRTVTVGDGPHADRTNRAIQKAVDDVAAAGGGEVVVPAGTYRMHDALHLRSSVRVVGRKGAVLKKVPSVSSALADHVIRDNRVTKNARWGVLFRGVHRRGGNRVLLTGNTLAGKPMAAEHVDAPKGAAAFKIVKPMPPIGPEALPPDGARHLGFDKLPPWTEPQ